MFKFITSISFGFILFLILFSKTEISDIKYGHVLKIKTEISSELNSELNTFLNDNKLDFSEYNYIITSHNDDINNKNSNKFLLIDSIEILTL